MFPQFRFSEFLIKSISKRAVDRPYISKVSLSSNPLRISFKGKEIVLCRFDYLKKLKMN
jgi:hypothetical protein